MAENVGRRGDSWFYRLELPPGTDRRRRQKRVAGFATERQAKAALAAAQVEVSRGRLQYAPVRTFADLAEEWLAVVGPNRKATTLANYRTLSVPICFPAWARCGWIDCRPPRSSVST